MSACVQACVHGYNIYIYTYVHARVGKWVSLSMQCLQHHSQEVPCNRQGVSTDIRVSEPPSYFDKLHSFGASGLQLWGQHVNAPGIPRTIKGRCRTTTAQPEQPATTNTMRCNCNSNQQSTPATTVNQQKRISKQFSVQVSGLGA